MQQSRRGESERARESDDGGKWKTLLGEGGEEDEEHFSIEAPRRRAGGKKDKKKEGKASQLRVEMKNYCDGVERDEGGGGNFVFFVFRQKKSSAQGRRSMLCMALDCHFAVRRRCAHSEW